MKPTYLIIIFMLLTSQAYAMNEREIRFDNNYLIKLNNNTIQESEVNRAFKYATTLYKQGRFDESMRLAQILTENYSGAKTPQINYLKSKILFMKDDYDGFLESYKKNYDMFSDDNFIRSAEYKSTLYRSIEKYLSEIDYDLDKAIKRIEKAINGYYLYLYIGGNDGKNLKMIIEDYSNKKTKTSYKLRNIKVGKTIGKFSGWCAHHSGESNFQDIYQTESKLDALEYIITYINKLSNNLIETAPYYFHKNIPLKAYEAQYDNYGHANYVVVPSNCSMDISFSSTVDKDFSIDNFLNTGSTSFATFSNFSFSSKRFQKAYDLSIVDTREYSIFFDINYHFSLRELIVKKNGSFWGNNPYVNMNVL